MSLASKTRHSVGAVTRYPTDLAVVSVLAVLGYYAITTFPTGSTVRFVATLAFVGFLPGYALTAVLFPARARVGDSTTDGRGPEFARSGGIDTVERLGLGLGLSIAIVPMLVLAMPFTEWGLATEPLAGGLVVITLVLAQLGAIRRLRVPRSDRYVVSLTAGLHRASSAMGVGPARVSSIVLVIAVLAAAGMLVYAFAAPMAAGGYTQLAIYTADDDGELRAEMPDTAIPDEEIPITFQIHNEERQAMNYTVVMQEQVVEDGDVDQRITHREINATSRSEDGGRITAERGVTPEAADGETVRIVVMLFEDDAPVTATKAQAMEYTYFWVTMEIPPDAPGTVDENATDDEPGTNSTDEGNSTVNSDEAGSDEDGDDDDGADDSDSVAEDEADDDALEEDDAEEADEDGDDEEGDDDDEEDDEDDEEGDDDDEEGDDDDDEEGDDDDEEGDDDDDEEGDEDDEDDEDEEDGDDDEDDEGGDDDEEEDGEDDDEGDDDDEEEDDEDDDDEEDDDEEDDDSFFPF